MHPDIRLLHLYLKEMIDMRYLSIFLAAFLLMGAVMAQSTWYPAQVGENPRVYVANETIAAAESADADQIANDASFNSTTKLIITSSGAYSSPYLGGPDVPRTIGFTPSGVLSTEIKITGTDIDDAAITENVTFTAYGGPKTSLKAFKTVTRIDATTTGTTRTVKIGVADGLGIDAYLYRNMVIKAFVNEAAESSLPTVNSSLTTKALNNIDTSTAPGGHVTIIYYLTDKLS